MKFKKCLLYFLATVCLLRSASALVMRPNGPEPIIIQIKESLRLSDDLDDRLNELASTHGQHGLHVAKWWAGRKFLVMLSFPPDFTEQHALAVIETLEQLPAVEKVVPVSAFNLHFRSGDFVRAYNPNQTIPDVARRGFDAERIGRPPPRVRDQASLDLTPHVPNRLIVGWKEEYIWRADATGFTEVMEDFHSNAGCHVVREIRFSPTKLAQVLEFDDPSRLVHKLRRYAESGLVAYAQPDFIYKTRAIPNDPWYLSSPGPQWSLPIISAPAAWDLTTGNPNYIIAVGDTGANVFHPEFSEHFAGGYNAFDGSSNVVDDDTLTPYHGSATASIVGAKGNNGGYMTGVAWDTSLMIVKVVSAVNPSSTSVVANGIMHAANGGATAINLSLGFYDADCYYDPIKNLTYCYEGYYDDCLFEALRYAKKRDMVVVCAAGNGVIDSLPDGSHPDDNDLNINRTSPASIPIENNISVLATNRQDQMASYSSWGKYRVDLGAPGGESNDQLIRLSPETDPNVHRTIDGTSAAAPHVAGALALIKSLYPWENYLGIRDRLLMGTDQTGTLETVCRTGGRLNLYKALQPRSMLRNLSTRARVQGGDGVMIGGFIIGGSSSGGQLRVCIRGLGPSLSHSGLTVPLLVDPVIELHRPNGSKEINDNWHDDAHWQDTVAVGLQPANSSEAAMVRWLDPGAYTVVVRNHISPDDDGVGLFEIYEVQNNSNEQSRLQNLSTRCLVGTGTTSPSPELLSGT